MDGRGTVDDKDSVVAGLMLMLTLKRTGAALDRDVIFLAESGEEGAPEFGAQFMIDNHFDAIEAEYCFAEGGGVVRSGGQVRQANIGTTEKEPRPIEVIAHGSAGHGSVPRADNAVVRLSDALAKIAAWVPPLQISETTVAYFRTLSTLVAPDVAARYRDVLNPDPKVSAPAARWLLDERAAALVHAPHVAGPDDDRRRLSLQRDSIRGEGDRRRASPPRRRSEDVPRSRPRRHQRPAVEVRWSAIRIAPPARRA